MKRRVFIQQSIAALVIVTGGHGITCAVSDKKSKIGFTVKQFEDPGLAQFSYAVHAGNKIVLIDPARDPEPYYEYAKNNGADIVAVVETHLHADFVSGHLQLYQEKQIPIYISKLAEVKFPHQKFDEGAVFSISDRVRLRALNTPGHSPDSISVVLEVDGEDVAVFSGDALLLGGVGRPDLREYSGEASTKRTALARQMYDTIHQKYAKLDDHVLVYPAHGAGSLCGSGLRTEKESSIGYEKKNNFAFEKRSEDEFVALLLNDRIDIPKYFSYDVELNKKGARNLKAALQAIPLIESDRFKNSGKVLLVDTRSADQFRSSHFSGAINIPERLKSETWLGTLVDPTDDFFLIVGSASEIEPRLAKAAKIGYEQLVKGVVVFGTGTSAEKSAEFDAADFEGAQNYYYILDVRTAQEAKKTPVFTNAVNIPLSDLKKHITSLPLDKPVAIHCASGYRSAIAASIIKKWNPQVQVYDIGEKIKEYADENKESVKTEKK